MRAVLQAPAKGLLAILILGVVSILMPPHGSRAAQGSPCAQLPSDDQDAAFKNDQIVICYSPPVARALMPLYERMRRAKTLEQLKAFLSPLEVPQGMTLKITAKECGTTNSWWSGPQDGLFLCYEWLDFAERVAPRGATPEGYTRDDAITGMFLQVTFHELGHGMFSIYKIPVLGREEDAADQMAGFIMAQFGSNIARRTLPAGAYVWRKLYDAGGDWPRWAYSDVHGHDLQRSYNYLCMAYGSDPEMFAYYVDSGLLPKERAGNCKHEADQMLNAFQKTMLPHIDPDKLKAVQAKKDWLPAVVGL